MMSPTMDAYSHLSLGARIRTYRQAQRLTQRELAKEVGCYAQDICALETGKVNGVTAKRLHKVAQALGVTTAHLLGEVSFFACWDE
jgi:transcriptional regulator with XRE-family HTH domain